MFEYDAVNHIFTKKLDFNSPIGKRPLCSLIELYGLRLNADGPVSQNDVRAIYPNPSSNRITIELAENLSGAGHQVAIYNSLGERLYYTESGKGILNLDISAWPCGVYVVSVIHDNTVASMRFVKRGIEPAPMQMIQSGFIENSYFLVRLLPLPLRGIRFGGARREWDLGLVMRRPCGNRTSLIPEFC